MTDHVRRWVAFILLPLALGSCEGAPSGEASIPADAPCRSANVPETAGHSGQIVFHSDPEGDSQLHTTRPDGTGVRLLTTDVSGHPFGAWSPDGSKVAFLSGSLGTGAIYVVNADGSEERQLTDLRAASISWSPDGRRIAFEVPDDGEIFVMGADGSDVAIVARPGFGPSWSPDCRRIAFFSDRDGDHDVYVMDRDGSGELRLTEDPADDVSPAWSPDGTRIAFLSNRDGNYELYVMDPDGSDETRLTHDPAPDEAFEWSPDGARIVYVSYRDGADPEEIGIGNAEVFSISVDGGDPRNLSRNPAWDGDPSWAPDGTHIVFTHRTNHGEVYVMRSDGSHQRMLPGLPNRRYNDCCADWQPT